jgi:hypothetical protein
VYKVPWEFRVLLEAEGLEMVLRAYKEHKVLLVLKDL